MNMRRSGYVNQRLVNLKMDIVQMANGVKPLTLRGWTLRAMKMGPTYEENRNWRAVCMKCAGKGWIDPEEVDFPVKEIDVNGRRNLCFSCEGKGTFCLPNPTLYKEVVSLWLMGKADQGMWEEIHTVCESELHYISSLMEEPQIQFELEVQQLWLWVRRRLQAVKEGGVFFNAPLPENLIAMYNKINPEEVEKEEEDIEAQIAATFARIEALLG